MTTLFLDNAPKTSDIFVWSDFLELHCLASADNIASIDVAAKEARSQSDNGIDTELFGDGPTNEELFSSPEIDDKALGVAGEALQLCYNRSKFFGDSYPFLVDKAGKELCLKSELSYEQKLYIALLLCSNNTSVDLHNDIFTLGFEKISKYAFKGILPPEALVLHVGTRQGEEHDCLEIASNKFVDKLRAIADKLNLKFIADDAEFTDHNNGDGGIDLIGIIPMLEGKLGEELIYLGQSATSRRRDELNKKQCDATHTKWCKWIKFNNVTNNVLFMSASLRQPDGSFIRGFPRNGDAIWVDRGRIIDFITRWRTRDEVNQEVEVLPSDIVGCIEQLTA